VDRLWTHPISRKLSARSGVLVSRLEISLPKLLMIWVLAVSFASGLRVAWATTPIAGGWPELVNTLPYGLAVGAPVATLLFGLTLFRPGAVHPQPAFRFARFGRWRRVDCVEARTLPLFGASGFMASLLIGMLLNVPVRTMEFLTAIPALGGFPPAWFQVLYALMLADLVLLSCLYVFAFTMALRHVPLFPRFLALVWGIDLLMQLSIAHVMGDVASLPPAVAHALHGMLEGNVKKALISIAIWLPYLLLSRRVNLTYRLRVPAA